MTAKRRRRRNTKFCHFAIFVTLNKSQISWPQNLATFELKTKQNIEDTMGAKNNEYFFFHFLCSSQANNQIKREHVMGGNQILVHADEKFT